MDLTPLTPQTITTAEGLAEGLRKVRERGYAVDDEESLPGLRSVGAPIWDGERVVATLSASGSTLVAGKERLAEIGAAVMETARAISVQPGGVPPRLW